MARTILLADDSMTIQKVVELTFVGQDYQVVAVSDGDSALERFGQATVDLVIADVHMPGANGYEVCRRIKASHPATPVLLLVGTFEEFDDARAGEVGADGNLKKPFDSQELLSRVEGLLTAEAPAAETAPVAEVPAPPPVASEPVSPGAPAAAGVPSPETISVAATPAPTATDPASTSDASSGPLSDADVDRIARRVVELLSGDAVREVAWEVIPDLAEVIIKERIGELERQVESI